MMILDIIYKPLLFKSSENISVPKKKELRKYREHILWEGSLYSLKRASLRGKEKMKMKKGAGRGHVGGLVIDGTWLMDIHTPRGGRRGQSSPRLPLLSATSVAPLPLNLPLLLGIVWSSSSPLIQVAGCLWDCKHVHELRVDTRQVR